MRVEQKDVQVGDRLTDQTTGGRIQIRDCNGAIGRMNRCFRDSVHVHELRLRIAMTLEPRSKRLKIELFSTENYETQRELLVDIFLCVDPDQLAKCRWRLVEHGDALAAQECMKLMRIPADEVRHDHQLAAVEQRPPYLPYRKIESYRMETCPDIAGVELEPMLGRREEASDVAMGYEGSLGQAGGA